MDLTRTRGYTMDRDEALRATSCIGAPVRDLSLPRILTSMRTLSLHIYAAKLSRHMEGTDFVAGRADKRLQKLCFDAS